MDDSLEIIDAFVDGQRVDPATLESALADPAGRRYLTDLIALREVVRTPESTVVASPAAARRWRWMAVAACVVIAGGGYLAGVQIERQRSREAAAATSKAPAPTRVIELKPGVNWHETSGGH